MAKGVIHIPPSGLLLPPGHSVERSWWHPMFTDAQWTPGANSLWLKLRDSEDGAAYRNDKARLMVIASIARESDGWRWVHISVSHRHRLPSWRELVEIKTTFLGPGMTALQVFPTADKYVNIHPRCLHLWCCIDGNVTPDFTRGGKSI